MIKGKTQVELALEAGFSQTMVSNFENGLSEPTQVEKERLADALGVSISDIFGSADIIEIRLDAVENGDS
jgi:transcriptional regulator with XRE-family HTH domain